MAAGSSTAIVATVDKTSGKLDVANLGDSVVAVVRRGEIVVATGDDPQQHKFNAPYQLAVIPPERANKGQLNDSPTMAQLLGAELEPGDVVFMATDGYSDNVFREMTIDVIKRACRAINPSVAKPGGAAGVDAGAPASSVDTATFVADLAEQLLAAAFNRSISPNAPTPFQMNAEINGHRWTGGKRDDITVMVALVEDASASARTSSAGISSPALAARCVNADVD